MPGQQTRAAEEAAIRKLIEQRAQALRAKDAEAIIAQGTDGMVHFSLAPPLEAEAGIEGLKQWLAGWDGPIGYEVTALGVTVGEDVAFAHCLNHMHGRKRDGERPDLWFRQTLGLRRIDGRWTIVHEHESVPFYMDGSFRAAVDLKP